MKKIEAIWEKENIGSNVLEIVIENNDKLSEDKLLCIPSEYDYIVIKVPVNKTEFNWCLGKLGFTMIETQIKLSKMFKDVDFEDRNIKRYLPYLTTRILKGQSDIDLILSRITPDMFITDRIALDPHYGPEIGCKRYKNYIKKSFEGNTAEIIGLYFKNELVGFDMHSIVDKTCYGKLGGIFNDVRIPGIGFTMPFSILKFCHDQYAVEKFVPEISSNNITQVNIYENQHFHVESLTYVFVKHQ